MTAWYNVTDYGAVGNGTADDTGAIQAAINAASSSANGGCVVLPKGTFRITAPLQVPNVVNGFSGIAFQGSGQGTSLKAGGSVDKMVHVMGARCVFRDMTFNGEGIAGCGLSMETAWDGMPTVIENCAFVSMSSQGILNYSGDTFMVSNCYFLNAGAWALEIRDNGMNSTFASNFIQGSGGVRVSRVSQQTEGLRIVDNTIIASGGSGVGVKIEYGLEIFVGHNVIDQVLTQAVDIHNNSSYIKVVGNWLDSGTGKTVQIRHFSNNLTISNNTFEGGDHDQLAAWANSLGDIHSLVIQGNIFNNTAQNRVSLYMYRISRATIQGNVIHAGGAERLFWNSGSNGTIIGNIIEGGGNVDGTAVQVGNVG